MMEFMIISGPRSASAWAANWLTTDTTLCLHEPTARWSYQELDRVRSKHSLGMACTATAVIHPQWLKLHPARKVVLHRDIRQIRASMERLGIPGDFDPAYLNDVEGKHHSWMDLFTKPKEIYEFLLEKPFDAERHHELLSLNIQNQALIRELQHAH